MVGTENRDKPLSFAALCVALLLHLFLCKFFYYFMQDVMYDGSGRLIDRCANEPLINQRGPTLAFLGHVSFSHGSGQAVNHTVLASPVAPTVMSVLRYDDEKKREPNLADGVVGDHGTQTMVAATAVTVDTPLLAPDSHSVSGVEGGDVKRVAVQKKIGGTRSSKKGKNIKSKLSLAQLAHGFSEYLYERPHISLKACAIELQCNKAHVDNAIRYALMVYEDQIEIAIHDVVKNNPFVGLYVPVGVFTHALIVINADGTVARISLLQSSGYTAFDDHVIRVLADRSMKYPVLHPVTQLSSIVVAVRVYCGSMGSTSFAKNGYCVSGGMAQTSG